MLLWRLRRGNAHKLVQIAKGSQVNVRAAAYAFNPRQLFAIRRHRNLANDVATVEALHQLLDALVPRLHVLCGRGKGDRQKRRNENACGKRRKT